MSTSQLWKQLAAVDAVNGEVPEVQETKESTPWYFRVLQGFAGWLAALFLIGFLGFGVAGFFDNGPALIILGVVINISAFVFYKSDTNNDFFEQLVLAFSLTGQFLVAFGLFEVFDFRDRRWLAIVAVYQVILVFVMNHYLHRFLSAWFAVIALFWGFDLLIYSGLGSALVAALFVWLWIDKIGWQVDKAFYEPVGYAMGLALLQLNVQSHFWLYDFFRYRSQEMSWMMQNAESLTAIFNSVVLIYFVYRVIQEQQLKTDSTNGKLVVLATVLLLFSALPVLGLSSAILVLLVGHARQNIIIMVMGGLALVGFVGWYYYSLDMTLLVKSIIMVVMGFVLLLGYWLVSKTNGENQAVDSEVMSGSEFSLSVWQKFVAVLTLLVILLGVNHAIWNKEQLLKNGTSVYLELAPVDPRSIMQGDYMRLRFAVANQILSAEGKQHPESNPKDDFKDGYLVVDVDDRDVGTFNALFTNQKLQAGQVKMQYRLRNNRVQFATNAFFFQEGDARVFESARFGEFKVSDDGELLLKAMYDQDLRLLGINRLD